MVRSGTDCAESLLWPIYMQLSNQVTQRNQVTWVIRECIYMCCSNVVSVNLYIHAADKYPDFSPTTNLILEVLLTIVVEDTAS